MLLVEGIGGDIGPYEEVLKRTGISTRPEAQVIKLQDKNRDEANDALDSIVYMIRKNYEETQSFTLVHCYLSVSPENLRLGKRD